MYPVARERKPIKKILCIRSDRLGEFLLTLPAIRLVKQNFPQAHLVLMAREENTELIRGISYIDSFLSCAPSQGTLKLARALRKERFDMAIIFNPKKQFNAASFLAGIHLRVGYDRKWGFLLNKKIKDLKHLCQCHEIEYNVQLASLVFQSREKPIPEADLPWNEKERVLELLRRERIADRLPYVVLHPFSSDARKEIDFLFWKSLIERITRQGSTIAIVGLEKEFRQSLLHSLLDEQCLNLCGKLTLRDLGNFLKFFCRFYVGVDSGPFHMASLLGVPFAALFSKKENIARWGAFFPNACGTVYAYPAATSEKIAESISTSINRLIP